MNVHPRSTPLPSTLKSGLESWGLPHDSTGSTGTVGGSGTGYTTQSLFPHFDPTHPNTSPGSYHPRPSSVPPIPSPVRSPESTLRTHSSPSSVRLQEGDLFHPDWRHRCRTRSSTPYTWTEYEVSGPPRMGGRDRRRSVWIELGNGTTSSGVVEH